MRTMKKLTALVVMAAFLTLQVPPAAFADDSDIFGANIQPNILILLDTSGSMDDAIPSQVYVAATTYQTVDLCGRQRNQTCVSTTVYVAVLPPRPS